MLTSLAFIFLVGLSMAAVCQRLGLSRMIGMLITGVVLGPYVLDLLAAPSLLSISAQLRQMALIICDPVGSLCHRCQRSEADRIQKISSENKEEHHE
mgnify:CR=1 FL=1